MKLFHLSDLHLGKRVNGFSMIEDQKYILQQILKYIEEEQPDGVLIAGDVYDKSVPSIEAIDLLDNFLTKLMEMHVATFIISGNHDSPERLGFAAKLIRPTNIRITQAYDGTVKPEKLWDDYGPLNIYMLPFIKPLHVRMAYPESDITTYTEALKEAISHMKIDPKQRNILIAHQFVTGAMRTDSEEISLGGSDNVDVRVFDPFDYVALGHIHRAQRLTRDTVRYSGTPLKYSFSEFRDKKSITVIEMKEKGNIQIRFLPLAPLHDMREIKGSYEELTCLKNYEGTATDDYLHITLTDEDDVLDAAEKLRVIYPNLMKLDYDNTRTRNSGTVTFSDELDKKSPLELFEDFFEQQNNMELNDQQKEYMEAVIQEIWEGK